MDTWGTTLTHINGMPKTQRFKQTMHIANTSQIQNLQTSYQDPDFTHINETDLQPTNQNTPTCISHQLSQHQISTLITTRATILQGHQKPIQLCPFCPRTPPHTILHCINHCKYPPLQAHRQIYHRNQEPPYTGQTNTHLTHTQIITALGGQHWTNTPTARLQQAHILTMIETSPILKHQQTKPT